MAYGTIRETSPDRRQARPAPKLVAAALVTAAACGLLALSTTEQFASSDLVAQEKAAEVGVEPVLVEPPPLINLDQMPGASATAGPGVNDRGNPNSFIDSTHTPGKWTKSPTDDLGSCSSSVYMTVDLGAVYSVSETTIWHYYGNDRRYCNQKIALSTTGR